MRVIDSNTSHSSACKSLNEQTDSMLIRKYWSSTELSSFENFFNILKNGYYIRGNAFDKDVKSIESQYSSTAVKKAALQNIQIQSVRFYYTYIIRCAFGQMGEYDTEMLYSDISDTLSCYDLKFKTSQIFQNTEFKKLDTVDHIKHISTALSIIAYILGAVVFILSIVFKNKIIESTYPTWFKNIILFPITFCNLIPLIPLIVSYNYMAENLSDLWSLIYHFYKNGHTYTINFTKEIFSKNWYYYIIVGITLLYNILQIIAFFTILL